MKITQERIIETRPGPHQWAKAYRVFHNNSDQERPEMKPYLGENECGIHFVVDFSVREGRCEAVLTPERRDSEGKIVEERFFHLRSSRWMPRSFCRRGNAPLPIGKFPKHNSNQQ